MPYYTAEDVDRLLYWCREGEGSGGSSSGAEESKGSKGGAEAGEGGEGGKGSGGVAGGVYGRLAEWIKEEGGDVSGVEPYVDERSVRGLRVRRGQGRAWSAWVTGLVLATRGWGLRGTRETQDDGGKAVGWGGMGAVGAGGREGSGAQGVQRWGRTGCWALCCNGWDEVEHGGLGLAWGLGEGGICGALRRENSNVTRWGTWHAPARCCGGCLFAVDVRFVLHTKGAHERILRVVSDVPAYVLQQ